MIDTKSGKVFVTGGAGFIGSNLVERLLQDGHEVVAYDNFSTGREAFLVTAHAHPKFHLVRGDLLDADKLTRAMRGCQFVFHLAANADVRFGLQHPRKDLEQNTLATFNVLEGMRANDIKQLAFSSTGSVYGEAEVIPTSETAPFPVQTSLYGASKVAGEALIQAYCEGYGMDGYIFRFVSILGERYTHGHVIDFYRQLIAHPKSLRVLGDGTQRKSYLYVDDCLSAMLHVIKRQTARSAKHHIQIYNLGTTEWCEVNDSIRWICQHLSLQPQLEFTGGRQGWIGDNPHIFLDTTKIQNEGWQAIVSIPEAVIKTLEWLQGNPWVMDS